MDIFHNSVLCDLESQFKDKSIIVPGVNSKFTESDMKTWWNKISGGSGDTLSHQSHHQHSPVHDKEHMFNILQGYAANTIITDKLIDINKLGRLGFSTSIIGLIDEQIRHAFNFTQSTTFLDQSNNMKFHAIFMAIFLNSLGANKPEDLADVLAMFVDVQKQKRVELLSKSKEYNQKEKELTVQDVIEKCHKNHVTNLCIETIFAAKIDELREEIKKVILHKVPTDEILLSTLSRVVLEPRYVTQIFENTVSSFPMFPDNVKNIDHLKSLMKGYKVNLGENLQTMQQELFTIVLPSFLMLSNMNTNAVVDIALNVLLGFNGAELRACHETCQFIFISEVHVSDKIIGNIDCMIEKNDLRDEAHSDLIIRMWKLSSAFIAFLNLFRLIFPQNRCITVGKTDCFDSSGISHNTMKEHKLALNCIYWHKNYFYLILKDKFGNDINLKTSSFYELFFQIYTKT